MARRARAGGFTYIGLLIAVAVIGVALAAVGQLASVQAQRERERELLFVGEQYRAAFAAYVAMTPPGKARYPRTLDDLVEDRRHIVVRRHLRQVYPDPFTNAADWEVVTTPDGGIAAIHSRHEGRPIKIGNFPPQFVRFEDARTYRDWVFGNVPRAPAPPR
jgi:type II secretory pathway pseudopilin PulG